MRSKRLLTLLLVVCMLMSCLTPAAAVQAGPGVYGNADAPAAEENETASKFANDLLITPDGKLETGVQAGTETLRDNTDHVVNSESTDSAEEDKWIITPSDVEPDESLLNAELPQSIQDLRAAAQSYAPDEEVRAFVVMEEEPLVQTYSSILDVPQDVEEMMAQLQEAVITLIEEEVLNGEELDVDRQFSYLANAFSITTEFANLEEIVYVDGVESVFIMPVFEVCEDDTLQNIAAPLTVSSGEMSGVPTVWETGYTGSGMTIAIIDTGLDLDHPSFADAPAGASMTAADIEAVLADLNASEYMPGVTAEDLYYSEKVPFAFNYVDANLEASHDKDSAGDHGTHVAGIAAANAVEGTGVVGMAPDAQLVVMKVFGANGGAYMDDIAMALEDAMTLGVDVVNASLGSSAGFSDSAYDFIDEIYGNLEKSGMVVNMSAGNDGTSAYGNMWGTDMNTTGNMDNAAVGSPSTYANVNSIASVDNAMLKASAITLNGENYMYNDGLGLPALSTIALDENGEQIAYEYVMVPGLGNEEDFEGLDVEGKIAVIARGTINFSLKLANAETRGAVAVIITNNEPGSISSFGMSFENSDGSLADGISGETPCILVSQLTGQKLADAETKTLTICPEPVDVKDEGGGQMSSFSSWGVSPDLRLVPDMAGVGGNVYSTTDDGTYGYMSGTSMSSPQVAGMTTLVVEYLTEELGITDMDTLRQMANGLMMSTAEVVVDTESAVEASPRQQGAGLVNALNAITSEAYLTVADEANNNKPKAELGHDPEKTGVYEFTFTVNNFSDADKTYALDASVLTEYPAGMQLPDGSVEYFMYGMDYPLSGDVTFSTGDSVTVSAGESADVTVTITLSDEDKAILDGNFPNGGYVEGYVYLTNADENGVDLHLPYLGFYGDWTQAPLFDDAFWYENSAWNLTPANGVSDGNQYFTIPFVDLLGNDWLLGFNPYSGALADENGNIIYDEKNNVLSPNGDGVLDGFLDMYISLMRNAKELTFTYTDAEGNVLFEEGITHVPKTMFNSGYGQIIPFVHSWYLYGFDYSGVADGQTYLTITGAIDYEGENTTQSLVIPVYVDTTAPSIVGEPVASTATVTNDEGVEEIHNYLTVTVRDNHSLAAVFLTSPSGTTTLDVVYDVELVANEDGTYDATLDITGYGTELGIIVCDYGANESAYTVTFSGDELPGGNMPEVDTEALYAYRVYDAEIADDSLYGWITIDKETGATTQLTNDMYEYYALTAAEYVDGYIFAVDAGDNFLVMQPGLFFRNEICNLGVGVLDMTFNKADNTMYVTTKGEDEYGYTVYTLATLDLLTGKLTTLAESDSAYDLPYAMAATDDGVIYAVKYYDSGLYTVNQETWTLDPVTDAEGNAIKLTRANGNTAYPYYSQSMTYDSNDGVIYWAFFTYTSDAELYTINPADNTFSSVEFPVDAECVGVLTLNEDPDYTLPESDALSELLLSAEELLMGVGESVQVTASALPWNYTPSEPITWTSGDETVATVDADGVVTAVSEGMTTVTATCEGVEATCYVTVVNVEGSFYTYNYYNGTGEYGDWISVDMGSMTTESLYMSPVDFMAADYNGHDGNIYGYDMNGQFYRFNPESGECVALGTPVSSVPTDMAYDYATGFMYAMTIDQNAWTSTLCYVNMNSGALVEVATAYDIYMTLACDTENSLLFAVSADGILYNLQVVPADGGGVMPLSEAVASAEEMMIQANYIMEGFGSLYYAQSMCWDHTNGVILWANAEASTIYWIDVYNSYALSLGDPTGSGLLEYIGLYTVPAEIPELPYFAVESVSAEDMLVLAGASKMAAVTINPLNATNQTITYVSADESVATVDETGMVTGVAEGTTTITGTLVDGETTHTFEFTVSVKLSAGDINAYIASDLATGGGQAWAVFPDSDPTNGIFYPAGCDYMLYSEEYLNGKLYAYGYDSYDWEANFLFMVINPETYEIESMIDMGNGFPFVYDMTFDYTTGTMYAVAGYNDSSSDLYMVNLENGQLVPCMNTAPFFNSIAAAPDGTLYGIAASEMVFNEETYMDEFANAKIYSFDVANGTYTELFDTGVQCNKLASMAFDYDTGNLYWSAMFQPSFWDPYTSGLYMIDLEAQTSYNLGLIGPAGSQAVGMYIVADEYPAIPDYLINVTLTSSVEEMNVGETLTLETFVQPFGIEAEYSWTSSDESVATVDAEGNVTAVGAGVATVTVTVNDGENTFTASCAIIVYGEDDTFLTYNRTQGGFAEVSRGDLSDVTVYESAEDYADVRSMAIVDGVIYGYDVNNEFFTTTKTSNFQRTYLGSANVETNEDTSSETYSEDFFFEVRDMAWDAVNGRMLAVGCESATITEVYGEDSVYTYTVELTDGCKLYEVDLTTGNMTELTGFSMGDAGVSNVYTLTVDNEGVVYIYSSYDDYVSTVDMETGVITQISTLQNQGVYGDSDGNPMAMEYDPMTGNVYMLFTQNGNYYQLVSYNPISGKLTVEGYVGQFDEDAYATDLFSGLIIDAEHVHAWTPAVVITEPTCIEEGLYSHECLICGEYEEVVMEALGHDWSHRVVIKKDSCTGLGYTISTCQRCGEVEHNWDMPHSHNYESETNENGDTVYTCTDCGHSYTVKKPQGGSWWDKLFPWLGGWWK